MVRLEREGAQDVAEWDFSDFPPSAQLAVVVADSQDFGNLGSQEAHRRLWAERSREWLHLSVDARLTVAEGSGHMVHRDRPDTVASHVLALIAASRFFSADYLLHMPDGTDFHGVESLKQMVSMTWSGLTNPRLRVEDMVAEGDRVATRWTMTAVHSGEFMGVAGSGKSLQMSGVIVDRFVEGRVVEAWDYFDMHGLLGQLDAGSES